MTVVLSTICTDSLVLCADREVSGEGEVKFYEKKIFTFPTIDTDVVLGYSGIPDVMKGIEEDLRNRLDGQSKSPQDIENNLQKALEKAIAKNDKSEFWTLCGFRANGAGYRLLKSYQRQITPVPVWDCIGIATNSSLIRYLGAIFLEASVHLPAYRAVPICNYIVAQAKKYIGGCGGPTDLSIIEPSGRSKEQFSSAFSDHLCEMVEHSLNAILTTATESTVSAERIEVLLRALQRTLDNSMKTFPALLR